MCEKYIDRLPLAHPQLGTWSATQAWTPTGNRAGDFLVHRSALNHTSQGIIPLSIYCKRLQETVFCLLYKTLLLTLFQQEGAMALKYFTVQNSFVCKGR